jgi:hypothetical protein
VCHLLILLDCYLNDLENLVKDGSSTLSADEFSDGGDFAAMEQSELLAKDLWKFATPLKIG